MRGVYANLSGITQAPLAALADPRSTMVGIGLTPEAIEQNPVMYDLMVCAYRGLYRREPWAAAILQFLCISA